MKIFIICLIIFAGGFLFYKNIHKIDDYKIESPIVDFKTFFKGEVEGVGMFFDYRGKQKSSFHVTLKGLWEENKLEEFFVFNDATKLERTWFIDFKENKFTADAIDCEGKLKGVQSGNTIYSKYVLKIPYENSLLKVTMDDWMYLIDDKTIINRTGMYKFGFKIGEMVIFLRKK